MKTIIVATPHPRNDALVDEVRLELPEHRVVRIRAAQELAPENLHVLEPDWIFFPHWSWIIPESVFMNFRCVIFHMTDLPFGRGGSPLQNLIMRGHTETRLTALRCAKELDAGPIYLQRPLDLSGSAEAILRRASKLIAGMVVEMVRTEPTPREQTGEVVVFKRRRPEESDISGLISLDDVFRHVRMLDADGYPHAFFAQGHLVYEFRNAERHGDWVEATVRIRKSDGK